MSYILEVFWGERSYDAILEVGGGIARSEANLKRSPISKATLLIFHFPEEQ